MNKVLLSAVGLLMAASMAAQERIDPTLEVSTDNTVNYSEYRFLKPSLNHVEMNGSDWLAAAARFEAAQQGDSLFTIVYLGDSHVQADFGGSVIRARIADVAGSAGRGLIIPFRMAGTNQPNDYTITGTGSTLTSRLLKLPWVTDMPFTGIGVQPVGGSTTLHITAEEPFDRIELKYRGPEPRIVAVYGLDENDGLDFANIDASKVITAEPRSDVHLRIEAPNGSVLAGLVLSKAEAGTFVHSIGNNGATYGTYNQITDFGRELASLNPDLVIVALGTNEAFGTFDEATMRAEVELLVDKIRTASPDAAMLLVTPTECYRKRYKWRRGRRRAAGQTVNKKAVRARNVIADFARDNSIPLYDTFNIVGGNGSAAKMKNAGVLGADGVHFTSKGYKLQGSLLADAILEALTRNTAYGQQ